MDRNDLAWTAFRAGLLSPLLTGEVSSEERAAYFQKLAQETHLFPNGQRKTISLRGKGSGHGLSHWTGNFDEIHDFEMQIRSLNAGRLKVSNSPVNFSPARLSTAAASLVFV